MHELKDHRLVINADLQRQNVRFDRLTIMLAHGIGLREKPSFGYLLVAPLDISDFDECRIIPVLGFTLYEWLPSSGRAAFTNRDLPFGFWLFVYCSSLGGIPARGGNVSGRTSGVQPFEGLVAANQSTLTAWRQLANTILPGHEQYYRSFAALGNGHPTPGAKAQICW